MHTSLPTLRIPPSFSSRSIFCPSQLASPQTTPHFSGRRHSDRPSTVGRRGDATSAHRLEKPIALRCTHRIRPLARRARVLVRTIYPLGVGRTPYRICARPGLLRMFPFFLLVIDLSLSIPQFPLLLLPLPSNVAAAPSRSSTRRLLSHTWIQSSKTSPQFGRLLFVIHTHVVCCRQAHIRIRFPLFPTPSTCLTARILVYNALYSYI